MLVHGSRLAIMRAELTAVICTSAGEAPLASAMRAMIVRAARTLAALTNRSVSTDSANAMVGSASFGDTPAASKARKYATSVAAR
jgi:hypothetical protein